MNKQTIVVVVAAVLLFGLGVIGAMAFTGGGSDSSGNSHTMDDGAIMTGPMMTGTMGSHTMDDGQTMTGMHMP